MIYIINISRDLHELCISFNELSFLILQIFWNDLKTLLLSTLRCLQITELFILLQYLQSLIQPMTHCLILFFLIVFRK